MLCITKLRSLLLYFCVRKSFCEDYRCEKIVCRTLRKMPARIPSEYEQHWLYFKKSIQTLLKKSVLKNNKKYHL